jgi:hypothetical protein
VVTSLGIAQARHGRAPSGDEIRHLQRKPEIANSHIENVISVSDAQS